MPPDRLNDPRLPELHIVVAPRIPGQEVQPKGVMVLLPGDSVEVYAGEQALRFESFVVTDAIRDADKARFAYTAELAEENRTLRARVRELELTRGTMVTEKQERVLQAAIRYVDANRELHRAVDAYRQSKAPAIEVTTAVEPLALPPTAIPGVESHSKDET